MLFTTICGSFRRFLPEVELAKQELADHHVRVLSPRDTEVIGEFSNFILLKGDHTDNIKQVEDRHLWCISKSNFVWLVCPDGYIGNSTAMEIGFAAACSVPIFSTRAPKDDYDGINIRIYVRVVKNVAEAVTLVNEVEER